MNRLLRTSLLTTLCLALACGTGAVDNQNQNQDPINQNQGNQTHQNQNQVEHPDPATLRVATFNASLYRTEQGALAEELSTPGSEQPSQIAEIIQIIRPDVILLNEFDYDAEGQAAAGFDENYLRVGQGDQEPIEYPYIQVFPSNTGVSTGIDLTTGESFEPAVGTEDYAQNSYGYGIFPGQYAFAVFSKYPLVDDEARSFQTFLWADLPDHRIPEDYYAPEALEIFRLSSKNHVDLPIDVGGHRLHLVAAHPTPPAFDGPEQRNVRRNLDEVRLIHDYIRPDRSTYLYDDNGREGGLSEEAFFVIVGDLNADPFDGGASEAIAALLSDPRVTDPEPTSEGGQIFGESSWGEDQNHQGPHNQDTANFNPNVGNLRVDYAIPSSNLIVEESAVFWPAPDQEFADLVEATDHRMVWVDVTLDRAAVME